MRRVHLFIATSLDGYIAGPQGQIDWLFSDQDYGYQAFYRDVDAVLVGRKTYEQALTFASYPWAGKQAYVFTRRGGLPQRDEVTFVAADPPGLVRQLQSQRGGVIWLVGGSELIADLLEADLIDDWTISIHPIVLGGGIPLFIRPSDARPLKLLESSAYETGLVQLRYQRDR